MVNAKLTQDELQAIKERADKATSGPWSYLSDDNVIIEKYDTIAEGFEITYDGEFIAHARQDIPKLVAEVERLQNKLALYALGKRNLDAMVEHKDAEIAELERKNNELLAMCADERAEVKRLQLELAEVTEYADYKNDLAMRMTAQCNDLADEVERLREMNEKSGAFISSLIDRIHDLEADLYDDRTEDLV